MFILHVDEYNFMDVNDLYLIPIECSEFQGMYS